MLDRWTDEVKNHPMTVETKREHDVADTDRRGRPSGLQMLAALGIATVADLGLMLLGPTVLGALLFVPPLGLLSAILLFTVIGLVTAGALKLVNGLKTALPGALAAIAAAIAAVALFIRTPEIPMHWVGSVDIGMLPAAFVATASAALALPRWWVKAVGAGVLLLAIGIVAGPPIVAAAAQKAISAEQDRQAAEKYLASQELPVTSDWTGARTISISGGESSADAYLVTEGGGAVHIRTYSNAFFDSDPHTMDEQVCWLLHPLGGALDDTITMARYQGICEAVGTDHWRLVDGTAEAMAFEGRIVTVGSAIEVGWADLSATRAAKPRELASVVEHLRTVTLDELRDAYAKAPSAD